MNSQVREEDQRDSLTIWCGPWIACSTHEPKLSCRYTKRALTGRRLLGSLIANYVDSTRHNEKWILCFVSYDLIWLFLSWRGKRNLNRTDGTEVGGGNLVSELSEDRVPGNGKEKDDVITTLVVGKGSDVDTRVGKNFVDLHNTLWQSTEDHTMNEHRWGLSIEWPEGLGKGWVEVVLERGEEKKLGTRNKGHCTRQRRKRSAIWQAETHLNSYYHGQ